MIDPFMDINGTAKCYSTKTPMRRYASGSVLICQTPCWPGRTSHHLRQLARFGLVVEAPELGKGSRGRERWWRTGHDTTSWDDLAEFGQQGLEAVQAFENVAHRVWAQMLAQFRAQASRGEWSPAWVEAAGSGDFPVRTTP